MGAIHQPEPVKLFVGMLAARSEGFATAEEMLVARFGAEDFASPELPFAWTDYYKGEMGEGLLRKFVSFERLIVPDAIADIKHATNAMEDDLAKRFPGGPKRPVNLDPGYLTLSKVVLATTKDYSHRLYLSAGIYAEVTLRFHKGRYDPWEWTYRDYRTDEYAAFFLDMRRKLTVQLKEVK